VIPGVLRWSRRSLTGLGAEPMPVAITYLVTTDGGLSFQRTYATLTDARQEFDNVRWMTGVDKAVLYQVGPRKGMMTVIDTWTRPPTPYTLTVTYGPVRLNQQPPRISQTVIDHYTTEAEARSALDRALQAPDDVRTATITDATGRTIVAWSSQRPSRLYWGLLIGAAVVVGVAGYAAIRRRR
jgi:hypothetical protein